MLKGETWKRVSDNKPFVVSYGTDQLRMAMLKAVEAGVGPAEVAVAPSTDLDEGLWVKLTNRDGSVLDGGEG